ncbi:MAG: metallophosphoesterase [Myxococcota bacterium]
MSSILIFLFACTSDPATSGDDPSPNSDDVDTGPFYGPDVQCGDDTVAPGSVEGLIRWPYVQNITQDGATVAWGVPDGATASLEVGRDGIYETVAAADVMDLPYTDDGQTMRLFHARVDGLEAGEQYCYQVRVDDLILASGLKLRTVPASADAPVKMFVMGDFGSGSEAQRQLAQVMAAHADGVHLWLTTGDNAYGSGTYREFQDNVFDVYKALFTQIPVYPTPGNHDYKTEQAQPYLDNFFLPEDAWRDDHKERYYTLDYGPMRYFGLDSESPLQLVRDDDEQSEPLWVNAKLAETDKPWKIAAFHRPYYSGQPERGPDVFVNIHLMPLFDQYGLDMALTGHNHMYERFAPMTDKAPDPNGTTWIVTGGGGQSLYEIGEAEHQVAVHQAHHFMILEINGCLLRGRAIGLGDVVLDEFEIDRCSDE